MIYRCKKDIYKKGNKYILIILINIDSIYMTMTILTMFRPFFLAFHINTLLFSFATISAKWICDFYDQPFYNPKYNEPMYGTVWEAVGKKYIRPLFPAFLSTIAITTIAMRFVDVFAPHGWLRNIENFMFYVIYVEICYYGYHQWMHTKPMYKWIHSKHHENIVVYPIDAFYIGFIDATSYFLILNIPVVLIKMNLFEYVLFQYIYICFNFISHSNLAGSHHAAHHRLFNCNFCLLFPIFDFMFDTMRFEDRLKPISYTERDD